MDKHKLLHASTHPYVAEGTYSIHNGLSGMFINQMVPDSEGNALALLSSANSVEKINSSTNNITHIASGEFKEGQRPNFVLCAEDGCIWIGFPGGVMRVEPSDNRVKVLPFDAFNHYEVLSMIEAEGRYGYPLLTDLGGRPADIGSATPEYCRQTFYQLVL